MVTLVEQRSRYARCVALPHRTHDADTPHQQLLTQLADMPSELVKSLTWDHGIEMARHVALSLATNVDVYFVHSHSSRERGTNENTNRLLREYFRRHRHHRPTHNVNCFHRLMPPSHNTPVIVGIVSLLISAP